MRKKVCFVSGAISRSGGTERVGTLIANELCRRGYEVCILSFWNHGEPYYEIDKKIEVSYLLELKEGKLYRSYIYPIIKLRKFIVENNIDILIDIDTTLTIFSGFARLGTKCKLISWEHFNYWTMKKDKNRVLAKKIVKIFSDKLVVLTNQDLREHIEKMNFKENKIIRIYNPSPFEIYHEYTFENHIFLSVGRLSEQKGFDILLRAWSIFESKNNMWKLQIVGSGKEEESLNKLITSLNLKSVEMIKHTKNIENYYKNASCYVLSSRYEGFPMVILEAESFGLPIISLNCKTGPEEMVFDGENGFLVKEINVKSLAKAMLNFTYAKERSNSFSNKSKRFVSELSIKNIGDQWEKLIDEL